MFYVLLLYYIYFHLSIRFVLFFFFFFFNDTATTEIYTLSLHDALPISGTSARTRVRPPLVCSVPSTRPRRRSEEHTSELQSRRDLVCRLLLEKKKKRKKKKTNLQIKINILYSNYKTTIESRIICLMR